MNGPYWVPDHVTGPLRGWRALAHRTGVWFLLPGLAQGRLCGCGLCTGAVTSGGC